MVMILRAFTLPAVFGAQVTGIAAKAQEGHYPIDPRLQVGSWRCLLYLCYVMDDK
jgi:hypothetical protein